MALRTHTCGELRKSDVGQAVQLAGWVHAYRDHGEIVFVDLRDRAGRTQMVFDPESGKELCEQAARLRREDVVSITGTVSERTGGVNPKMPTGEIEVMATGLEVLNKAEAPPILPDDQAGEAAEEHRLRYRYLDLRSQKMQHIIGTRHRVLQLMRSYLAERGFWEIETPFLCRSTPEGARDYLVPSRIQAGRFYALPQSPQLFKQILMASGCDKYMQIVRCFRDEDPRADRQAEFTQLDIEMSFVEQQDVMDLMAGLYSAVWQEVLGVEIGEIPVMAYADAMERYGIDRPDLRFAVELKDIGDLAGKTDFRVFTEVLKSDDGVVKAICVPGGASMSRKQIDGLAEWAKQQFGAGGVPTCKVGANGTLEAGISKFLGDVAPDLIQRMGANEGDLICFACGTFAMASQVLGELRVKLGRELGLIDESQWKFVWITDFPLLHWNEEEERWDSPHHPFTSPVPEQLEQLESDPGSVLSRAYDLVLNGSEVAGGSIRIHRTDVQQRVFNLLGIDEAEAKAKFHFLLDALRYGCPPHGGIAVGLDRTIMHLTGTDNIRDVIAFPKTLTGMDLMTQAPSEVDPAQLEELHVRVVEEEEGE
ncbi:MAG: aspartate--tRNA ligase [Planctomycetes bacterium]|nr:aspartate--tRNA ligase [Planctomycetota bacterium]NOG52912.1 aspartate--tRNA ligase [Planctomycetota bacterium]